MFMVYLHVWYMLYNDEICLKEKRQTIKTIINIIVLIKSTLKNINCKQRT